MDKPINEQLKGIRVAILTVSDSCSSGDREDISGQVIRDEVEQLSGEVVKHDVVPDEIPAIKERLSTYSNELKVDLVLTTGGTGFSPRDITPEATLQVLDKEIPGIPEAIRAEGLKKTKRAILSRAVAGIKGRTLIINFPGSSRGVKESLAVIIDIIPHALEMIRGGGH
ncbi:MAG: MogA/MoaB family molybdenum cofactor biosynthesis protein [Nitrospinota bacterium]|nr:MogA/MoaB family molybdenum cofactor biosynthesis protein [Nitrospinota bacterium]